MKAHSGRLPVMLAAVLTILALAALMVGPYMHESDQASLLAGGVDLARGRFAEVRSAYNFDKQYVSYVFLGALFQFLSRPLSADAVVLLGNAAAFGFFWSSWLLLLRRIQRGLGLAAILPLLLAPTLIVHSPFFATAFVSTAFLLLAFECFSTLTSPWRRRLIVGSLVFCAVGARADAVLALPLIALLNPRRRTVAGVITSIDTWILPAAGLVAVLFGRLVFTGPPQNFIPPQFRLNAVVAFTLFGLGGALLLMPVCLAAILLSNRRRNRTRDGLTAAALVIPAIFYLPQLMSPRYYVLSIVTMFLFVVSRRGGRLLSEWFQRRHWGAISRAALIAAAVFPLVVGLQLPDLRHPRLSLSQVSRFPSGDGVLPMGCYWRYLAGVRIQRGFVDHNHAIWAAVSAAPLHTNAAGAVPALYTTMNSYLLLSATLQNRPVQIYSLGKSVLPSFYYVDSRSLMRSGFNFETPNETARAFLAGTALQPASPVSWEGITLYRGSGGEPNAATKLYLALNDIFGGGEFRIHEVVAGPTNVIPLRHLFGAEPKKVAVACAEPLACSLRPAPGSGGTFRADPSLLEQRLACVRCRKSFARWCTRDCRPARCDASCRAGGVSGLVVDPAQLKLNRLLRMTRFEPFTRSGCERSPRRWSNPRQRTSCAASADGVQGSPTLKGASGAPCFIAAGHAVARKS